MKRSWFPILIIIGLLGLLSVLATLQYQWLGKISNSEREQTQKRLETDTQRFAEDFNREIQSAYFSMQLEAAIWQENNFSVFAERFDAWRSNAKYPALIKNIYFVRGNELLRFDQNSKNFVASDWTEELVNKKNELAAKSIETVDEKNLVLAMPIYENIERFQVQISTNGEAPRRQFAIKYGYLFIKLDDEVIKNQMLPELANKYFSDSANADFQLTIVNPSNPADAVFQSSPNIQTQGATADASAELLDLSPDSMAVFVNRDLLSDVRGENTDVNLKESEVVLKKTNATVKSVEQMNVVVPARKQVNYFNLQRSGNKSPLVIEENLREGGSGRWLLNVRHADGSLENFINKTRRRNLAVSFGILALLAISVILIFVSAQRAKRLAQRQMDFVSAVSHEFRTPLAVIYSASENLTDGVVQDEKQVARYGNLIKREGKKLSAMVEQILEFAGARSGRRKYDFRVMPVDRVIEKALTECDSLLNDKRFKVEVDIAENLPPISVDEKAISQAIQNLITNAVKYGEEHSWLKISAKNGNNQIKIAVEDQGIGISSKDIKNVFEPFYRAKSVVDAQIHGNGLGLSLVKQAVEAHEGKIAVESEPEKGSKFTIYLPIARN